MSDVLTFFRQRDSRFEGVPDSELTAFIGKNYPKFLQEPEFNAQFMREMPPSSMKPVMAAPFAPGQVELSPEQQAQMKMQADERAREVYEATLRLAGDDVVKRAALQAAHKQAAAERGVTVLDVTEWQSATKPMMELPRVTGEQVAETTGLPSGVSKVMAGAEQAAAGLVEFFLTPLGVSTLGLGAMPGTVQRNVTALFAADMASTMPQQAQALMEAFKARDVEQTTAALIGLGVTPLFVRGALRHATPEFAEAKLRAETLLESAKQTATLLADPTITGVPLNKGDLARLAFRRGVAVVKYPSVVDQFNTWIPATIGQVRQEVGYGKVMAVPGGKLSTSGQEFVSVANTPGFLQTAEQRLTRQVGRGPVFSENVAPTLPSTPLRTVDELFKTKTVADALVDALESGVTGQQRVNLKKAIEQTTGVGVPPVGLNAAETILFNEIWEQALVKTGYRKVGDPNAIQVSEATPVPVRQAPEAGSQVGKEVRDEGAGKAQAEVTPQLEGGVRREEKVQGQEAVVPTTPSRADILRLTQDVWKQVETARLDEIPKLSDEQLLELNRVLSSGTKLDWQRSWVTDMKKEGIEATVEEMASPTGATHVLLNFRTTLGMAAKGEIYKRGLVARANAMVQSDPVAPGELASKMIEWPPQPRVTPPSSQALGIVPPGARIAADVANKFTEFFRSNVSPEEVMPFQFSDATPLPRFQPYEVLRATVTKPFGIGKVGVLGRFFDPRYRGGDNVLGAVIINAYSKEMGNNISKIVGAELAFANKEFKGLPISDFVEAYLRDPESVVATEAQIRAITIAKRYIDDALEMMAEAGIERAEALRWLNENNPDGLPQGYFPRTWLGKQDVPGPQGSARGLGLSTKPGALKERKFESEAQGREAGHIYEEDFAARVADYVQKAYHAVANKRFVEDPRLGGETIRDRMETMAEGAFGELAALKQAIGNADTKEQMVARYARYKEVYDELAKLHPDIFQGFKEQVQPTAAEGATVHPALRGMIFDKETLNKLNEWLTPTKHKYLDMISKVNAFSKSAQLALDNSAPLVQGLPLLFAHPTLWAKAMAANIRAWKRPDYLEHELVKPEIREAALQLAQLGTSFRVMNDYMAGLQKGSFMETRPVVGPLFKRAGGAFGAFIDLAKINLWMAVRDNVPRRDWFRTAEAIDNIMGSARGKSIGKSVARMEMSQNLMLAPAYYMSGFNLTAGMFSKGFDGVVIRRAMGRMAAGVVLTTLAGWAYNGLSLDDMADKVSRMDFTVPVEIWGGKKVNVGFTHILLSLAKASAATFSAIADKRTPLVSSRWSENKLMQLDPAQNPLMRWLWGHSAPLVSLAIEQIKDYDFLGQDVNLPQSLLRRIQPLWMAQVTQTMEKEKSGMLPVIGDALASGMGLNAYPQNYQQLYRDKANKEANKQFGVNYDQLSVQEQQKVAKVIHKIPEIANKPPASKIAKEQATKWQELRRQRMTEALTPEAAAPIHRNGLHVTTFDPKLSIGGEEVWLTGDQQDQLEAMIVEEYNRLLPQHGTRIDRLPAHQRQDYVNEILLIAKERAKMGFVRASAAAARARKAGQAK